MPQNTLAVPSACIMPQQTIHHQCIGERVLFGVEQKYIRVLLQEVSFEDMRKFMAVWLGSICAAANPVCQNG